MKRTSLRAFIFFLMFFVVSQAYADDLRERASKTFKPIPETAPDIKGNTATVVKVKLGKMLYFDPRLSSSALISCNTCHNIGMGGMDYQETSVGHGWQKGPRNAPTVLNSVFNIAQFWDGRAKDLREQAKGPVQASVEMNSTPGRVIKTLNSMPEYIRIFKKAFPADKEPVSFDNMAKAIEVFEATLLTPDSRFDKYLKGDKNALNKTEKEGLGLFMGKGCSICHGGVNMGGQGYYPFGVVERPEAEILQGDKGRFKVTHLKSDEYVFKAPSLRNIEITPPYFHSGQVWNLKEAIIIMGSAQLGIQLTNSEANEIVSFLKTTTGVQPKIEYPILPAPTADTPRPKLD